MKFPFEQVESRLREFQERRYMYSRIEPLDAIRIAPEPLENPLDFSEKKGPWRDFHAGDAWPEIDSYFWLHIPVQIPRDFPGDPRDLLIRLSKDYTLNTPEGLVFINGAACRGIDRMHHAVRLCEFSSRPKNLQIAVRVYSGSSLDDFRPAAVRPAHLEECALAALHEPARDFYHLAKSLYGALSAMPGDSWIRARLLDLLVEAFNRIDYRYPRSEAFYASIQNALRFVKTEIKKIPAHPRPETVTCVGHSHIDLAWLWPLQRTREKAIHTFSTALDLMRRFPEHRFFQSQAQLYDFVKNDQPQLFRKIKERIQQGQWEADGGMWVEADCNLPSGESLVRQFLYGRRFFEEELGVSPKILWLPDVFGYSWALPQILRQAEIDYFVTSKISWNQYNQMPHDLFRWRGVDGSEILTYFITVPCNQWFYTYNGLMEPKEIQGTWENFKPKSLHNEVLLTYGYGDGGGGPTEEMLLTARSLHNVPGFPKTKIGRVDEFLKRLAKVQNKAP
ncbi:MAG: alpha-mannosidase, partial [Candidatus Hinthialibacter sp.]